MRYLLTGVVGLLTLGIFYSCQKELSVEYSSAAKGSLQSSVGDCLPKTLSGGYIAAKALNDTNYIEVTVTVTSPGPYKIYSDTLNGYAFVATGTFAATGPATVRLKGTGNPVNAGTDDFTVYFDESYCNVAVTVLPAGSGAATFSLAGSPNACGSFSPFGNYIQDTTLDGRHYINVTVNVTAVGTYSINTNTVNGYFFAGTGTFSATGSQTIKLTGSGRPTAAGTDAFTVTGGGSTCTFTLTVTTAAPASCNPNVQGTYTAGTATTAANKVTFTHTYTTAGLYTVNTNAVNGYSFALSSTFTATTGINTVTLTATGTPAAAGSDNFTVNFGDGQTCSFSVTVVPGTVVNNTDYFPTTQGSYWTYDYLTDTFKVAVNGTQTYSSQTYQKFVYSGAGGPFLTELYRKDPSNSFYYQAVDTSTLSYLGLVYTQPKLVVNFLKNTLSTGATWLGGDFPATFQGAPVILRFSYKCTDANATVVWNGKTFTNVYKVILTYQAKDATDPTAQFQDIDGPYEYHYAKGVGMIWTDFYIDPQTIRFWQVN